MSKNYSLVPSPPKSRLQRNFKKMRWGQGCSPPPKIMKALSVLAFCRNVL